MFPFLSAFNSSLTAALSDFDYTDFNALVKRGEELKNMVPWEPTSGRVWVAWMTLGVILAVIAGLTGVMYLCRLCVAQIVPDGCWSIDGG